MLLLPLAILAVPLGDMVCVILSRLLNRQSPFAADNRHLHHRLLGLKVGHKSVVLIVHGLTLATSSLAFVLLDLMSFRMFFSELVGLCALACWVIWTSLANRSDVVEGKTLWFLGN